MISKKQLEDAVRCNCIDACDDCAMSANPHDCLEVLAQTALAYRAMLKQLEWVKCPGHEDILFCPKCGALQIYGHKLDCELTALLTESEVEEG